MPDETKPKHTKFLRIQSDGTGRDTIVSDSNGRVIDGITSAVIYMQGHEANEVSLTIIVPETDVHAVLESLEMKCPFCAQTIEHTCPPSTIGGK